MKILGQDSNGRIVIDGEGETVYISNERSIPADSPVFITNFRFISRTDIEPYDELIREK